MTTTAKLIRISWFPHGRLLDRTAAASARRHARLAQSGIEEKRFGAGSSFKSRIERRKRMRRSFRERKVRSIVGGEMMFARQFQLRDRTSVAVAVEWPCVTRAWSAATRSTSSRPDRTRPDGRASPRRCRRL
jgi:hypothetical protein